MLLVRGKKLYYRSCSLFVALLHIFSPFVSFQLLDYLLGHRNAALFRRAELKTLVDMHGNEVSTKVN